MCFLAEVEELSGRLKASRQRVADLERNFTTASNSSQKNEKVCLACKPIYISNFAVQYDLNLMRYLQMLCLLLHILGKFTD